MNLEETKELYEFLKGETPKGFVLKTGQPQLSDDVAFTIIYVLQEKFNLIPDIYEQCYRCKELYDTDWGGSHYEDAGINLCDGCEDHVLYRHSDGDFTKLKEAVTEWHKVRTSCQKVNKGE